METINFILKKFSKPKAEVPYDELSNNGLIINDQYIPEELLSEILCYIDYKTLRTCQLVCKQWKSLIQSYVWRKKAEMVLSCILPADPNAPWTMYYLICDKKPFDKNLIKNHSGKTFKALNSNWKILHNGGNGWTVECPPVGVPPLPEDPIFNGMNHCFVTSYQMCWKEQVIDLLKEGFSKYLLDHIQPTIKISEWYSARFDCSATYTCTVELIKEENLNSEIVFDSYKFSKILEGEEQNEWFKFEHEFKNYGKGLRKVKFAHAGQDRAFWAGHYGSKMAGACIKLEIPKFQQRSDIARLN